MAIALDQVYEIKPLARPPRCNRQSLTHLDYKILDFTQSELAQSLEDVFHFTCINRSSSTPCLSRSSRVEDNSTTTNSRKIEMTISRATPQVRAFVIEVTVAMATGVNLEPASSGLGGAYFLRAQNGKTIAVVKPIDEEPFAFDSPKGMSSIRIGETGLRESAAYLLDHDGFSGVPPTALVKFSHFNFNFNSSLSDSNSTPPYKIASLQRYVDHDSDAGDLGPSSFSVSSVHRIGILDVRLMNLDRHAGNILVRRVNESSSVGKKGELVPIDHGFCLPESLDGPYFEWLHWPQASIPFEKTEVDYVSNLDPFKDADVLRSEIPSIRESSIRVLILCTVFLKRAMAHGLCLADIGEMMTREFRGGEENWSSLEKLCMSAKIKLNKGLGDDYRNIDRDKEVNETLHFKTFDDSMFFPKVHDGKGVNFGDMHDEEWQVFLEIFGKLLPEAFERRKNTTGLSKHEV